MMRWWARQVRVWRRPQQRREYYKLNIDPLLQELREPNAPFTSLNPDEVDVLYHGERYTLRDFLAKYGNR